MVLSGQCGSIEWNLFKLRQTSNVTSSLMKWMQWTWQADESTCSSETIVSFYKLSVCQATPCGKPARVWTGGSGGIMRRLTFNDSVLHDLWKPDLSGRQCLTVEVLLLSLIAVMSGAGGLPVKSLCQFLLTVHSSHRSFLFIHGSISTIQVLTTDWLDQNANASMYVYHCLFQHAVSWESLLSLVERGVTSLIGSQLTIGQKTNTFTPTNKQSWQTILMLCL